MRTTPENVTTLTKNQIFVFGSNLGGLHFGGAARTATMWGAKMGQAEGMQGWTYSIPTMNEDALLKLPVGEIKPYVDRFIEFAGANPDKTFLVTEIGCGIAGHKPETIAPLFREAKEVESIWLPERFWKILLSE
jgi:hypothetical protein